MGVCSCSMFCCTLLYVNSSIAIILMGKRELVDLLNLSSWCLVMVKWLFLAMPWGCLRFLIVIFPDYTHYFCMKKCSNYFHICKINTTHLQAKLGAQWLSGRVFDSKPRGRGFEPHQRHCVVVLEQDTFILAKYWFNPGRPVPA